MTQKNYLNFLKSVSKKYHKNKEIFDIILYGSSVKGKLNPKDIDILIIFKDKKEKEAIDIAYEFKQKIKEKIKNSDVKTINLVELFSSSFLARQGVLIEGISLIDSKRLSDKLGFKSYSLFTYSLINLNHNSKTKFTYALIGRKNKDGMIKKTGAEPLGKGAVIVPIEQSLIFEEFLESWSIKFRKKNILLS